MFKKESVQTPSKKRRSHCSLSQPTNPSLQILFPTTASLFRYIQKYTPSHSSTLPSEVPCAVQLFGMDIIDQLKASHTFMHYHGSSFTSLSVEPKDLVDALGRDFKFRYYVVKLSMVSRLVTSHPASSSSS